MLKEVRFIEELGLWLAEFGDINLLYDDIIVTIPHGGLRTSNHHIN